MQQASTVDCWYILPTNSEVERFAPNTLQTSKLIIASIKAAAASTFFKVMPISISHSEGAWAPSSMLIVRCDYSEISFHFCEDCRIFCEGVKGNGIVEQKLISACCRFNCDPELWWSTCGAYHHFLGSNCCSSYLLQQIFKVNCCVKFRRRN